MRLLITTALSIIVGCATMPFSEAANNGALDPEVEVIVAYLQSDHASKVQPVILDTTTSVSDLAGQKGDKFYRKYRASLLAEASKDAPADLIVDFCKKNKRAQPMWPELNTRAGVVLLSRQEVTSAFGGDHHTNGDGWRQFYTRYPHSDGIRSFSRVGFNRQGSIAMFWGRWTGGSTLGWDQMYIMRKQGTKWVRSSTRIGPVVES